MIFMFHEADEDSCSKKNKFEESWTKAYEEFENKYGWDGDGLKSEEQKEKDQKHPDRNHKAPEPFQNIPEPRSKRGTILTYFFCTGIAHSRCQNQHRNIKLPHLK